MAQRRQSDNDSVAGFSAAAILLECGFPADVVRQWLCEDFALSPVQALVAVEAALRERLQALFPTSNS